jgi:YgiT-type zinc finger domain-containing protein
MDDAPAFQTGRALWEGDVGVSDVSAAWKRLFGEPFDKTKAIERRDLGDATGFLMPGGYVVYDETYDTNHGIYAPPRKAPEGAVWGLRIEPRADPVVMPILLPPGYVLTDSVRKVYQLPGQGEDHTAKSRRFVFSAWRGTVYVLSGDERTAEREWWYYHRTAEEAVLDAVKDWYDKKRLDRNLDLAAAVERWYVPEDRQCQACMARGRVHPTTMDDDVEIGGKRFHVANVPVLKCGACGEHFVETDAFARAYMDVGARALRYYGPTPENLVFARKALGYCAGFTPIDCKVSGDQTFAWEQGGKGNLDKLPYYAGYLVERLETTW